MLSCNSSSASVPVVESWSGDPTKTENLELYKTYKAYTTNENNDTAIHSYSVFFYNTLTVIHGLVFFVNSSVLVK